MANPPIDLEPVMDGINAAFTNRSRYYNFKRGWRSTRLAQLNKRLTALHKVETRQSQQISLEAQWLINYTDDWARADRTLDWFETSLDQGNKPYGQQPDGSWGVGCTEFYRKLEPTVDALQEKGLDASTLGPLTFMQDLQKPKYVTNYLDSLRVSRIHQTGRNNRDEFGSVITSLTQLFFKSALRDLLNNHSNLRFKVSDASYDNLKDYLWSIQSYVTGYWGPTYDFGGDVVDVQDLSYTFHVVKFYNDSGQHSDVPKTNKIIQTTQTIEDYFYPNGLKPNPRQSGPTPDFSDHNNYDLVTMFQQVWPAMSGTTQAAAGLEIRTLINWCLTKSLQDDQFAATPGMSMANSYYYAISFLAMVGFWLRQPFWTTAPVPVPSGTLPPKELADRLLVRFKTDFNDNTKSAHDVIDMLNDAKNGVVHPITLVHTPAMQCAARRVAASVR
jgi:hypothetical protein